MGPTKRSREYDGEAAGGAAKKVRKAFRVGPANLPDGAWKRKNDRIKQDLINKAKLRKEYKKIRADEFGDKPRRRPRPERRKPREQVDDQSDEEENLSSGSDEEEEEEDDDDDVAVVAEDLASEAQEIKRPTQHKDALPKTNEDDQTTTTTTTTNEPNHQDQEAQSAHDQNIHKDRRKNHQQGRKPGYFDKAKAEAERRQAAADARKAEYERRNAERAEKTAARERYNRALKKARTPGRDGQRRLGRESGLLLEKVKRMTGNQ